MWPATNDWLLRALLAYLDHDDVYRFWVFAEEHHVQGVRDALSSSQFDDAPVSRARAQHLAMGYACWTAVARLTKSSSPTSHRLSRRVVNHIVHELTIHDRVVSQDHPDRVRAMLTAAPVGSVPAYVMYFAATEGNLESVMWLHHVARYDPPIALQCAAREGHDHVIVWLLDHARTARWETPGCSVEWAFRYVDDPELGILAWRMMCEGKTDVSAFSPKWGFADSYLWWGPTCHGVIDLPASHGDLDAIKRMLGHGVFQNDYPQRTARWAAKAGHLNVLHWLYELDTNLFENDTILMEAAVHGHLEVSHWAATHIKQPDQVFNALHRVVEKGHVHVLRWLVETFPEISAQHLNSCCLGVASSHGQLITALWLVDECGARVEADHASRAARNGHRVVFQWLLERLRQSDGSVVQEWESTWLNDAAQSGDLVFVRWLVGDCRWWSPSAWAAASTREIAEFLHSFALRHNEPEVIPSSRVWRKPMLKYGAFEALAWQLQHGLVENRLEQKMFDTINDVEKRYAMKQAQLGWPDYSHSHACWPRTPTTMANLRELVRVVIDVYNPDFLCAVLWLPKWAIEHGTIATLERLDHVHHPKMELTPMLFRLVLRTTRNADKVKWFLTKAPSLFSTRVVRWAVQFDKRPLLAWLLDDIVPSCGRECGVEPCLAVRCLETARRSAQNYGQREIARLLDARSC